MSAARRRRDTLHARVDRVTGRASVEFARLRIDSAAVAVAEETLLMARIARDLDELEGVVFRIADADARREG